MVSPEQQEVTRLLQKISSGSQEALEKLIPLIYNEMKQIARHYLQGERRGHTLNTTALVHEAYIKLVDQRNMEWKNRAHFLAIAAKAMRRILIDYARAKKAGKRGGGIRPLPLDSLTEVISEERAEQYLLLDESLKELAEFDEMKSKIIEYQFFGGLSVEETAEVLSISVAKVNRDRKFARAWLHRAMKEKNN